MLHNHTLCPSSLVPSSSSRADLGEDLPAVSGSECSQGTSLPRPGLRPQLCTSTVAHAECLVTGSDWSGHTDVETEAGGPRPPGRAPTAQAQAAPHDPAAGSHRPSAGPCSDVRGNCAL